jgi:dGTPase
VIRDEDLPADCIRFLGRTTSDRIDTMVRGVIGYALASPRCEIGFGEELEGHVVKLRDFLYEHVYDSPVVHDDFLKCSKIIKDLYGYFLGNPADFLAEYGRADFYDDPAVCVTDFLASMTDRYAFTLYEKIFLPMPWKIPA